LIQTPPPSPHQARTSAPTQNGPGLQTSPAGARTSGYCGTRRAVPCCSRITIPTKNPLSVQLTPGRGGTAGEALLHRTPSLSLSSRSSNGTHSFQHMYRTLRNHTSHLAHSHSYYTIIRSHLHTHIPAPYSTHPRMESAPQPTTSPHL